MVVLAYGSSVRPAMQAVLRPGRRDQGGVPEAADRLAFPDSVIYKLAEQVDLIVVPEMNVGKIARECERQFAAGQM